MTEHDLILKYPLLKKYIQTCFKENRVEELMEFLDGLVLEENPISN